MNAGRAGYSIGSAKTIRRPLPSLKGEERGEGWGLGWRMRGRRRFGFTLIEMLLIVVIMMLAAALAVPSFVRSYRGAKLRTAARTVVMVHRHARSMAVLGQKEVGVLFDVAQQRIEVVSVAVEVSAGDKSMFLEHTSDRTADSAIKGGEASDEEESQAKPSIVSELTRRLPDGVKIDAFESEKVDQEVDGIYWVKYNPNGMSDPYTLRLIDENQQRVVVEVDPISGKAKVDYE